MSEWGGDSFSKQGFSVTLLFFSRRRHLVVTLPNTAFSACPFALWPHSLLLVRRPFLPTCRALNPKSWSGRRTAWGTRSSDSSRRRTTSTGSPARSCRSMIQLYSLLMPVPSHFSSASVRFLITRRKTFALRYPVEVLIRPSPPPTKEKKNKYIICFQAIKRTNKRLVRTRWMRIPLTRPIFCIYPRLNAILCSFLFGLLHDMVEHWNCQLWYKQQVWINTSPSFWGQLTLTLP